MPSGGTLVPSNFVQQQRGVRNVMLSCPEAWLNIKKCFAAILSTTKNAKLLHFSSEGMCPPEGAAQCPKDYHDAQIVELFAVYSS